MVVLTTKTEHQPCFVLQVYVISTNQNLHGLGYDSFKHATECRGTQCSAMKHSITRNLVERKSNAALYFLFFLVCL